MKIKFTFNHLNIFITLLIIAFGYSCKREYSTLEITDQKGFINETKTFFESNFDNKSAQIALESKRP